MALWPRKGEGLRDRPRRGKKGRNCGGGRRDTIGVSLSMRREKGRYGVSEGSREKGIEGVEICAIQSGDGGGMKAFYLVGGERISSYRMAGI